MSSSRARGAFLGLLPFSVNYGSALDLWVPTLNSIVSAPLGVLGAAQGLGWDLPEPCSAQTHLFWTCHFPSCRYYCIKQKPVMSTEIWHPFPHSQVSSCLSGSLGTQFLLKHSKCFRFSSLGLISPWTTAECRGYTQSSLCWVSWLIPCRPCWGIARQGIPREHIWYKSSFLFP